MVNLNTLPKICILVAFGISATVTSTDVAQEQPKKEELISGISSKENQNATEHVEVAEPTKIDTEDPPKYSVEWYLLPEPESRKELRKQLPWAIAISVPKDCNEPIAPEVEQRIMEFSSLSIKEQRSRRAHSYGLHWVSMVSHGSDFIIEYSTTVIPSVSSTLCILLECTPPSTSAYHYLYQDIHSDHDKGPESELARPISPDHVLLWLQLSAYQVSTVLLQATS
ncbi:hypothetical protein BBOV_III000695 [Babesia bovis T2Bo]|uniref:hypothetical protein n=1 Tax=Babesia bovis T2Bo TaxID=484906 RepID=UPI001C356A71|nr:hypothetical protein BBOV_III000695 [Babesia bovis T2Bo]KAG6439994.1 hypothetical protein BBOV_III000695 [Babesia bovis T2Bo]